MYKNMNKSKKSMEFSSPLYQAYTLTIICKNINLKWAIVRNPKLCMQIWNKRGLLYIIQSVVKRMSRYISILGVWINVKTVSQTSNIADT